MTTKEDDGKGQISTPRHAKTLSLLSAKFAGVTKSQTSLGMLNFIALPSGILLPV